MSKLGIAAALPATFMTAAAPAIAAPTSASRLSVAGSRSGASTSHDNKAMGGGAIFALAIVAGVAAIAVLAATNGDDKPVSA